MRVNGAVIPYAEVITPSKVTLPRNMRKRAKYEGPEATGVTKKSKKNHYKRYFLKTIHCCTKHHKTAPASTGVNKQKPIRWLLDCQVQAVKPTIWAIWRDQKNWRNLFHSLLFQEQNEAIKQENEKALSFTLHAIRRGRKKFQQPQDSTPHTAGDKTHGISRRRHQ